MLRNLLLVAAAAWLMGMPAWAASDAETAKEIVAMERRAMDGWLTGNPDPTLAAVDAEISYFHIMTDTRLDGIAAVKALFEQYRGRPLYESYDMVAPKVQVSGDTAVLSYILTFQRGGASSRWNATQVYRRSKEGWRVIHSHWSQTKPAA